MVERVNLRAFSSMRMTPADQVGPFDHSCHLTRVPFVVLVSDFISRSL
jgi:hypothetical protein